MLQIYIGEGDKRDWYYVRMHSFDYREGMVACRNLSNEAMLQYRVMDNGVNKYGEIYMNCDSISRDARDCSFHYRSGGSAIGLTCMESISYNIGDIRQLEDGRIVQLREIADGELIWAHFCFDGNNNWNEDTANLVCKHLGYDRVKPSGVAIEVITNMVYGLVDVKCPDSGNFSDCYSSIGSSNGRCDRSGRENDSVIAVECENIPTNATVTTTTVIAMSTNTSTSTNPRFGSSTTNGHELCGHTTYSTYSYNKNFLDEYMIYIIAGGFTAAVILICCIIGVCSVVGIMIYCIRKKYSLAAYVDDQVDEVREKPDSRQSTMSKQGEESYLPMASILNGTIGEQIEQDKHYYIMEDLLESAEYYQQQSYVPMRPKESKYVEVIEPYYTHIGRFREFRTPKPDWK
ncbi:hypothetical protein LOD99_3475 [Oopsacas minuta]|uniref:SRCR domain-containing protein n=1 Tax=Oopsacas minuta TaxID=111878 RepID=A0AAV7JXP3_9METZ|nr:hypothetical protein LOD99_3475 [Oopsacas minuta]